MNRRKKPACLSVFLVVITLVLLAMTIYIAASYHRLRSLQKQYREDYTGTEYQYHCAFISDDPDDVFWQSVYNAAKSEAARAGILLEAFGQGLHQTYSTDELLKMAIAADVDAVILTDAGNSSTTSLINQAAEQGIALCTVFKDDIDSNRVSFIGINSFRLGREYGLLAAENSSGASGSVIVFQDSKESPSEQHLLLSGLGQALQENDCLLPVDTLVLNESSPLEAEASVREFLMNARGNSDILICTDLLQTQTVIQSVIDLNCVSDFTIIGTYQSESVLEALRAGVICASVVVDTQQMGKDSIRTLEEYLAYGHTSDYITVNLKTLRPDDASALLLIQAAAPGESEVTES